jgi:hypothetical protein
MRGKVVGSYKPPLDRFAVWAENGKFLVVAPSGARLSSHDTAEAAEAAHEAKQTDWDRMLGRAPG